MSPCFGLLQGDLESECLFDFFPIVFFLFFSIDLHLTCVCVVTGATCNTYEVVFSGCQAVRSVYPRASSATSVLQQYGAGPS